MNSQEYRVFPLGRIRAREESFRIEIAKEFRPALKELDKFSHIQVFCWYHLTDRPDYRQVLICDKPYKRAPAKIGVFATRSPVRPNPVALTTVLVLSIDHTLGHIIIPYIDAEDGTPVIDIKPYHPATERVRDVSVPAWCSHWPQWYEDSAAFDWAAEFENAR
jgi:tRNA-Thr(GGU) m(6)t(6)A37 methyltransferase TsaA